MTILLGTANGNAKLVEAEVLEIYEMAWAGNHTQVQIAKMFGVCHECVSRIKLHKNWKWLTNNKSTKETKNGCRNEI